VNLVNDSVTRLDIDAVYSSRDRFHVRPSRHRGRLDLSEKADRLGTDEGRVKKVLGYCVLFLILQRFSLMLSKTSLHLVFSSR